MPENSIYIGHVYHKRHQPFIHKFKYRVFTLFVDLDDIEHLSNRSKIFSFNKWNILSINNKDHAKRDGSPIRPWVEHAAKQKGIDMTGGKIFMLTFPRLWGYLFNPLTIYFCYGRDKNLKGILYQVRNTFGEQHGYMLKADEKLSPTKDYLKQEAPKVFHVSPFIHMDCRYEFIIKPPDGNLDIGIHQFQPDGKILTATWDGKRHEFSDRELVKAFITHPLMTFKIITAIHWEALFIWRKGAKYISKPNKPENDIT